MGTSARQASRRRKRGLSADSRGWLGLVLGTALALQGCAAPGGAGSAGNGVSTEQKDVLLETLEQMGRHNEAQHKYGMAIDQYAKLVKAAPENPAYLLGLARNLRYAGQPQRALEELRRAVSDKRVAETPDIELEMARALLAAGLRQDAAARLASLKTRVPGDPRVLALAGIIADREGHHREAQAAYRAALATDPDDLRSANNLALSLALSGDLKEAVAVQSQTVQASGATLPMHQNFALLLALDGRMDEAVRLVRSILPPEQAGQVIADLARLTGRLDAVPMPSLDEERPPNSS